MSRTKPKSHADVNAAARVHKALQMRQMGYTYERIAEQCGYGSRAAAFNAVQRELKRQIAPVAEDVRQLELSRLDQLLTVFYAKAMKGDGWSADRVLRFMERRAAYLGLDAADGFGFSTAQGKRIVVVSGEDVEPPLTMPPHSNRLDGPITSEVVQ